MARSLKPAPQPLAYNLPDAADAVGISLRQLTELIAEGTIARRYVKSKPVIPATELTAWLESLPFERP